MQDAADKRRWVYEGKMVDDGKEKETKKYV